MSIFKYFATNKPVFWTPNSEWKPNRDCFRRVIPDNAWTEIERCPLTWVDNFTITTILQDPSQNKWTLLRVDEYSSDLPNAYVVNSKYFYLKTTDKRLKNIAINPSTPNTPFKGIRRASEYTGVLDVWLTYGLDLIEKMSNDDKHPILVERFLHPRMFRKYLELKAFKQDDELFNYQSEEKVLAVSAQPQLLPAQQLLPTAPTPTPAENDFTIPREANMYWNSGRGEHVDAYACIPNWFTFNYDESLNQTNDFKNVVWYQIVLANDENSSYTIVQVPSVPVTIKTRYYKKFGLNSQETLTKKLSIPLATKDEILAILDENQRLSNKGYWTKHIVGIYKTDVLLGSKINWCVIDTGKKRKKPDGSLITVYTLSKYSVKPDDVFKNKGGSLDSVGAEQENLVNSFYPSAFMRLTSNENDKEQLFEYAYMWRYSVQSGNPTVSVTAYNGIGAVNFIKDGTTVLKPQNSIRPWIINYKPTGDEPLNVYAMGRVKYWDTYLNPSFRWLSLDHNTSMRWLSNGKNTIKFWSDDNYITSGRMFTNVDGIGYNGSICYTGNHWMFSTNGSWGFQIHTGNETLPLLNSSYQTYLASQRSQINTGLQVNKELYATQMKHLNTIGRLNNLQGGLGIGSNLLGVLSAGNDAGLLGSVLNMGKSITDLKQKQEANRYAKEQATYQYRHYNMKVNAQLADARVSAKPEQLLTSDSETIVNNALESLRGSRYTPFTYLWTNDPENVKGDDIISTTGYEINTVTSRGFDGFATQVNNERFCNTTCCTTKLVNAPLDKYGRQFYNKLTWNVGMRGNFYATGLELFNSVFLTQLTEPTRLTSYYTKASVSAGDNNFYYLKLVVTPDVIRQFAQYDTLEVFDVLSNMFNDGIRIWNQDPTYAGKDFIITGALTKDYYDDYTKDYQIKNPVPVLKGGSKCSSTETDLTKSTKTTKKRSSR